MTHTPWILAACVAAIAGAPAGTARAQAAAPQTVVFGGVEASSASHYAYVGAVRPVGGGTLGQGPFVRVGASLLGYRYDTTIDGQERRVRARAPGLELAGGWAFGTPEAGGDLSLGVGVRDFRLSPEDPSSDVRGTRAYLSPQLALHGRPLANVEAELLANGATGLRAFFARARLGWRAAPAWKLGPELQLSRGPDYRDERAGLFVATTLAGGWGLGLQGGRARDRDGRKDGYLGLSVSQVY